jgi:tRNA threonylcarbamoyladenosine biosynthesis protein TsaB
VVRSGRVAYERSLPPDRKHVENLAGLIEDVLKGAHCDLSHMDAFAVTTGPGSFSGIRIGLAVAKGMALALRKPLIGVSCLEALAWESLAEGESGVPIIDARRGEIYTALYRRNGTRAAVVEGPFLMRVDELEGFTRRFSGRLVLSGDPPDNSLAASRPNTVRSPVEAVSAAACALIAHSRLERGETDDVHGLTPLYIRRSDAEEKQGNVTKGQGKDS